MFRKTSFYLSSYLGLDENGNKMYGEPTLHSETIAPAGGNTDLMAFGDRIYRMFKMTPKYEDWVGKIKENDLIYLYGATPDGEQHYGDNANYVVYSVRPQNLRVQIHFERRNTEGTDNG